MRETLAPVSKGSPGKEAARLGSSIPNHAPWSTSPNSGASVFSPEKGDNDNRYLTGLLQQLSEMTGSGSHFPKVTTCIYCSVFSSRTLPLPHQSESEKVAQSCLTLCNPIDCPWNSPGQNTGVGSLSLLRGNLPNPRIELRPPTLQADSLPAEPQGKATTKLSGIPFF